MVDGAYKEGTFPLLFPMLLLTEMESFNKKVHNMEQGILSLRLASCCTYCRTLKILPLLGGGGICL